MIRNNCVHNYKYDPQHAYDFSKYLNDLSGISIYYGLGPCNTEGDNNFKVKFNVEYPNTLYKSVKSADLDFEQTNRKYDLVLEICPYTCKFLNNKFNTTKFVSIFFPLPDSITTVKERIYPVFYSGHIFTEINIINIIYNALNKYLSPCTVNYLQSLISSPSINSYYKKLDIYSQTKIAIIHNVLSFKLIPNINTYLNDETYKAYFPWHIESNEYVPQIKSRLFEAAMMGCIPLVYKDKYNLVEKYFTENKEFIYFTDYKDLISKIDTILANYDKYKIIGENAQKKFYQKYTFKHFIDIIKTEYNSRINKA